MKAFPRAFQIAIGMEVSDGGGGGRADCKSCALCLGIANPEERGDSLVFEVNGFISELRTQNSEPALPAGRLKTQNSELRTQNSELRT